MKIYLVGGAVRDELLGLPIKEKDWVVVGATVDEMLGLKFRPVGKDFPVFLHPITQEEYALARTERKVGRGYTGFNFNTSKEVTLEEDLKRRDLTINAIAKNVETNQLIDPFHGKEDLQRKILRHVSLAFAEDPVRILRAGRFASRFAEFTVADETIELMKQMVASGEVDALVSERVWKELERALGEKKPVRFFEVLQSCGALKKLFPMLNDQALIALEKASNPDPQIRFAVLLHALSESEINALCDRYRVPNHYRELALITAKYRSQFIENIANMKSEKEAERIVALLQSVDAFRRKDRYENFLTVLHTIYSGFPLKQWQDLQKMAANVDVNSLLDKGFTGKELGEKIQLMRQDAILKSFNN